MAIATDSGKKPRRQCDITRERNALARKARICEQCGIGFTEGKLSAKQIAAGHRQRFCSNQCRADSRRVYATKEEAKRTEARRARERKGLPPPWSVKKVPCRQCAAEFDALSPSAIYCSPACGAKAHSIAKDQRDRSPRQCGECGVSFAPEYGNKRRRFCSEACKVKSTRRSVKGVRRARKRVQAVETVDPIQVFMRDGWRCQLCGRRTPRKLRGKMVGLAPELDHIVPLSKGGAHSYRNTQCACRACNGAKSDSIKGQMLLFG